MPCRRRPAYVGSGPRRPYAISGRLVQASPNPDSAARTRQAFAAALSGPPDTLVRLLSLILPAPLPRRR